MRPPLIYIPGPMTGLPQHNFPAFHAAADRFAQAGYQVATIPILDDRCILPDGTGVCATVTRRGVTH
jgi:hypothetical protein